jgi:NitT/TauT family transport system permease protein
MAAKRLARAVGAVLFWAAVWVLAALAVGQPLILPSPGEVAATLMKLGVTAPFWLSAGQSLLNVFIGFTAGVAAGTGAAFLTVFSGAADLVLSPALRVIRATPVASFIILALLWLGKSGVPAFSSALMVTPIVWQAVSAALRETDAGLLEMARSYRFGRLKTLRLVYLPSIRNQWSAACATSMEIGDCRRGHLPGEAHGGPRAVRVKNLPGNAGSFCLDGGGDLPEHAAGKRAGASVCVAAEKE